MNGRKLAFAIGIGLVMAGTVFGVSAGLLFLIASVLFYRRQRLKAGEYATSVKERLLWRSSEKTWLVAVLVFVVMYLIGFGATLVTIPTQDLALTALTYLFATKGLFLMNELHVYEQEVNDE
ncbi:hypothetical protein [Exiguobacterium sp. AB2]|uniref:hypothetical protein n=1 Tax=Exiguobacterium sp. AB2 TaxID=1484479 RepID=UPI0004A91200|nr:hypothetical protein [Exiguobacterium sp. AB2]KDN58933.1 hypothetical protein DI14_14605 [Exiguobacterium sp. AB2]